MPKKRKVNKEKKAIAKVKASEKLLAVVQKGEKDIKLRKEIQNELCMLKGCFFSHKEIVKVIEAKFEKKFLLKQIEYFFSLKVHREQMLECRQNYLEEISEVPIAHKRIRLERLEKLYESSDGIEKIKALTEARKEVEGELQNLTLNVFKKYEGMPDEELETRQTELLKRIGEYSGRIREAETVEPV